MLAVEKTAASAENATPLLRATLDRLWKKGMRGRALLGSHTEMVDRIIQENLAAAHCDGVLAAVAVGGYGRRELFPFSDIDLLLLYDHKQKTERDRCVETILYPLWDAGLDVGHSVRTVETSLEDALEDHQLLVSLLDARLVAGCRSQFDKLCGGFGALMAHLNRPAFFSAMQAGRQARLERFGRHSYMLEPHIKESRGGMRDLHTMRWLARVVFGLQGFAGMEDAGILSAEERWECDDAWDELVRIRNRLHYVSGRKNDQLFFEHQEEMARNFGCEDQDGVLAVENFMGRVHGCMQTLAVACELFIDHTEEVLGRMQAVAGKKEKGLLRTSAVAITSDKNVILRLFHNAASGGLSLHYQTKKLIRAHLHLVDSKFRSSRRNARLFCDILTAADPLPILEAMRDTGVLCAYLPEFESIACLTQHDIYHIYTVDIHLLHTVAAVAALRGENDAAVFDSLPMETLALAALLHDIGKGKGSGHAQRGAVLARAIALRLGMGERTADDLEFLVENHLYLSDIALRRDLEDGALIQHCAAKIGDRRRLAMLHLLAIADARATGPQAWNEWKAALLLELTLRIDNILAQKTGDTPNRSGSAGWMRARLAEQADAPPPADLAALPDDYLFAFSVEEILFHLRSLPALAAVDILSFPAETATPGVWNLSILSHDRPGLLAGICGALALRNLVVLDAKIFTWNDGTVVDVLSVRPLQEENFAGFDWDGLRQDLILAYDNRREIEERLRVKLPPVGKKRRLTPRKSDRVVLDNTASNQYTIIEVYAADRIGLLHDIASVITENGLNISLAKIGANADQAVDVFYVQDAEKNKAINTVTQEKIRRDLIRVVGEKRGAPLQYAAVS